MEWHEWKRMQAEAQERAALSREAAGWPSMQDPASEDVGLRVDETAATHPPRPSRTPPPLRAWLTEAEVQADEDWWKAREERRWLR